MYFQIQHPVFIMILFVAILLLTGYFFGKWTSNFYLILHYMNAISMFSIRSISICIPPTWWSAL
jgi:hypothetical protein